MEMGSGIEAGIIVKNRDVSKSISSNRCPASTTWLLDYVPKVKFVFCVQFFPREHPVLELLLFGFNLSKHDLRAKRRHIPKMRCKMWTSSSNEHFNIKIIEIGWGIDAGYHSKERFVSLFLSLPSLTFLTDFHELVSKFSLARERKYVPVSGSVYSVVV